MTHSFHYLILVRTKQSVIGLGVLLWFVLAGVAGAIQTHEVEIGEGGAYDGTVKIGRDAQGRLTLSDNEVTTPVTLNTLRYSGEDHGLLVGLVDDDHTQYILHTELNSEALLESQIGGLDLIQAIELGLWTGSANLTMLGVIGSGTWQATPIDKSYLDADLLNQTEGDVRYLLLDAGNGPVTADLALSAGLIVDTTTLVVDEATNKVGVGTASPLSTAHVMTSNASLDAVSSSADDFVIENAGNPGMTLLGGLNSTGSIYFGDHQSHDQGRLVYEHANDKLSLWVTDTRILTVTPTGVGIGVTAPGCEWTVQNGAVDSAVMQALDPDGNNLLQVYETSGGDSRASLYNSATTEAVRLASSGDSWLIGGNVGIGTSSPGSLLDVRGDVVFNEDSADVDFRVETDTEERGFVVDGGTDYIYTGKAIYLGDEKGTPPTPGYVGAKQYDGAIFSACGEVWVIDTGGNQTQISSHLDPRLRHPQAVTSFAEDSGIDMPFSFHHRNPYLGQACIVDMAKLAAWVEQKMQAELGEEAGRIFYYYDLEPEETVTLEQDLERRRNNAAATRWVEVTMATGSEGETAIPPEAFEQVEETTTTLQVKTQTTHRLDLARGVVVDEVTTATQPVRVATGRMEFGYVRDQLEGLLWPYLGSALRQVFIEWAAVGVEVARQGYRRGVSWLIVGLSNASIVDPLEAGA